MSTLYAEDRFAGLTLAQFTLRTFCGNSKTAPVIAVVKVDDEDIDVNIGNDVLKLVDVSASFGLTTTLTEEMLYSASGENNGTGLPPLVFLLRDEYSPSAHVDLVIV